VIFSVPLVPALVKFPYVNKTAASYGNPNTYDPLVVYIHESPPTCSNTNTARILALNTTRRVIGVKIALTYHIPASSAVKQDMLSPNALI
jgi:hypothetical protein